MDISRPAEARPHSDLRAACLDRLRSLEGLDRAEIGSGAPGDPGLERMILTVGGREEELCLREVRTHLSYPLAQGIAAGAGRSARPTLLFAPHVGPEMGRFLREHGLHYVDRAGNCWLSVPGFTARVEGRPPTQAAPDSRALRAPGLQVVFAFLARPALVEATVREVAEAAGVSKSTAANVRRQLEKERLVGRGVKRRVLTDPRALVDRWLSAYAVTLRPRLLLGCYATRHEDPPALERAIEDELGPASAESGWAWGGGAAADRLTGHYRGERTTVHLGGGLGDLAGRLGAVLSPEGRLELLRAPGPLALRGPVAGVAAPLLVVAELLSSGDERAAEAAQEIRERFLAEELR